MKILRFIFLVGILTWSGIVHAQTEKISISAQNVDIDYIFKEIRTQTSYGFFFNDDKVSSIKNITIQKENVTVKEVLDEVLKNSGYTYELVGDVITIKKGAEPQRQSVKQIMGTVVDEDGVPIPGVHVNVKNSGLGTVTDIDGNFQIRIPGSFNSLYFSFIGYEQQEVEIGDKRILNVQMKPQFEEIAEVVVTGYQVIDKREVTSAISTIEGDDLDEIGALSVDEMLVGKATGLMVSNVSSTPGAAAKVRVRAGSTFTGNQSPLWVVDGVIYEDPVPLSAAEINSFDNINLIGNALTGVNPQDIESINVLKDASATAIYGTRAANGVIVITTKRGKVGKPSISYQGSFSFVDRPRYSDMYLMNSKERIDLSREMYEKNLGTVSSYANLDYLGYEGALKQLWNGTYNFDQFQNQVSYLETLNADWFDALYQPSLQQQHSISASGGSDNMRYYFSVGYDDQQGPEIGVGLDRITGRSNLDLDITDNLLVSLKFSGSVQEAEYNHNSINVFNQAYYTSRTIPVYEEDGDLFYQSQEIYRRRDGTRIYGGYNVLNEIENSQRNITNKSFTISGNLQWKFLNNFRFQSQISYRNTTNMSEEYITEETFYISKLRTYFDYNDFDETSVAIDAMVPFGGIYSGGMVDQKSTSITNQLNYNKVFNSKHVLNINLAQEARSTKFWGSTGWLSPGYNHSQGRSFIVLPAVGYSATDNIDGIDANSYEYKYMISWLTTAGGLDVYPSITDKVQNSMSVFGIFNYVYDNRYVLNFNLRSDGSNTFGQYERYKFKPVWSVSTRWNIHNEAFWNDNNVFEQLSLRSSFGFRGSMPNASPYLIISDYGKNDANYYPENIASLSQFPNATLRWERTGTFNLGLNYSMYNGRVSGAFDYSYSKSTDLLQTRPISLVNGGAAYLYNSGSKDVQSYEFSVRTVNVKSKDFSWSTNLNFSHDKDRVLEGFEEATSQNLSVSDYLNGTVYTTGFPSNGFFSYQFDGLDENGLPTFKNLVDETGGSIDEHLKSVLKYEGSRIPLYYGGFGTEVKYKSFTMSANFTYKLGYRTRLLKLYNGNQNMPYPYENARAEFNDRWRNPGDEQYTSIPALSDETLLFSNDPTSDNYVSNYRYVVPEGTSAWWMYDYSDARVVKGDHIRWQSFSVSYQVPSTISEKINVKNARLSLRMSNIAVWSLDKKLKGQDPEQVIGLGLPTLPNYGFSVNMSF
uniref:SusC/RagA family TonB-linked outer membrane protein n=1 Tax=uncultured Draconibacterium sp. TaxID=1573823 RepID=UPI003216C1F3